jgi:hypothetical protein
VCLSHRTLAAPRAEPASTDAKLTVPQEWEQDCQYCRRFGTFELCMPQFYIGPAYCECYDEQEGAGSCSYSGECQVWV